MTPIYLPSQHASVHDVPLDPKTRTQVLTDIVAAAIEKQQVDGNFEDPAADDDIGDMSLGVISLLCLAWNVGIRRDEQLIESACRGADHFLRERVFRTDNPGEAFLRRRDSGLPYARYMPGTGEHPFGDWPSTVWAMLHAVNVVELGEGLLTDEQYAQVTALAVGYWSWLTEVSMFNPQQTANQAIGSIAAALTLARLLRGQGRAAEAEQITADAHRLYRDDIRAERIIDRGFALPVEHGAGHDQNYVPISLTFLAKAYEESGDQGFLEDGDQIARHLETRLSVRGFDFGGPRYSEQHSGFEGTFGLRYFGRRIGADLGRYLGDRHCQYQWPAKNGAPSGHFAFATVWLLQDDAEWFRRGGEPHQTPYSVRSGRTSVTLTGQLTPYVIDAADSAVIEAVADRQHGIGPVLQYPDGSRMLLTRPLGPMRSQDTVAGHLAAKLVTKPVVTRDQVLVSVQQLVVCDGERVHLVAVVDRGGLPADASLEFLAGLPYLESSDSQQRKIVSVSPTAASVPVRPRCRGRRAHHLGHHHRGPTGYPRRGQAARRQPARRPRLTSTALVPSASRWRRPRSRWPTTRAATAIRTAAGTAWPERTSSWPARSPTPLTDLAVFAVSYGPATDPAAYRVTAEAASNGVRVHTPDFSALIGHPSGDEHGDPILTLTPSEP